MPPKADGEYWFLWATPWDSENLYDSPPGLVLIRDGKRAAESDGIKLAWLRPECESPGSPVWDPKNQNEMLAAWKPVDKSVEYEDPPHPPETPIAERFPQPCPKCNQPGARYLVRKWVGNGPVTSTIAYACFSCDHRETRNPLPSDY